LNISEELVRKYEKGTFPSGRPDAAEVKEISELLFTLHDKTVEDYENKIFEGFKSYMTTPKIELNSVEDAIAFNSFHEGLHLGSIMALMRAVKN